ncbi:hypothetical protein [Dyadobacter sp. Leaf189]|uniref:hypothetical protein n=1 Tax=Dyadobacter sp. Leaf189 TaxID=1736295 RepID=UPI000A59C5EF|nr:hypothetical protein [Dyadobacter sp. Leaf189]
MVKRTISRFQGTHAAPFTFSQDFVIFVQIKRFADWEIKVSSSINASAETPADLKAEF